MTSSKENTRTCCVCGSSPSRDPSITLHRFPKPGTRNSLRCEIWAKYCFPNEPYTSPKFQNEVYLKHNMLCSKHFRSTCFVDKRLFRTATPDVECDKCLSIPFVPGPSIIEPIAGPSRIVKPFGEYYWDSGTENTILHSFPNPSQDMKHYLVWAWAVGRTVLALDPKYVFKTRRACHDHFERKFLTWTRKLCHMAVPTLGLLGSSVVRENNGDQSANTTNVTPQSESNNDENTTSELINRRTSCDTTDSVKSSGIREDPLAIEEDEVADRTVSDSESYLEDIDEEISEWSDGIFEEFAQKWEPILKDGLIKGTQDEINSNYLFCKNLPSSKPPLLNTEIANLLTEEIKSRDNELVNKQSQLGHALAALGKAMTGLRTNTMEASDILETLNDVGELIADLHYLETEARRSLIVQELDNSLAEPLKDRVRDEYLFGQDVGEILKPPEVKTTASSITPRMISTFLNKKKVQSPAASSPVRQITKITVQKNVKRPAALTPGDQITKKLRQCIETSLTTLRTREEELSSDTGTAAPDPDPDQTTTDPTAALSQLNIQIYDENGQPLSPEQQPAPSLTNDTEFLEEDVENKDNEEGDICIILLDDASLT